MSAEVDDDEVDDDSGPSVAEAAEELAKKKKEDNDRELEEAKKLEETRQKERDAQVAASWKKKVQKEGTGREAYAGAQCHVHVVGRAHVDKRVGTTRDFVNGSVFEDSRARQCPLLLLLGRGILVPGLDKALLSMRAGERATITIAPEGGYGGGGSISNPVVPGSATLTYDVEVLSIEKEEASVALSPPSAHQPARPSSTRTIARSLSRPPRPPRPPSALPGGRRSPSPPADGRESSRGALSFYRGEHPAVPSHAAPPRCPCRSCGTSRLRTRCATPPSAASAATPSPAASTT